MPRILAHKDFLLKILFSVHSEWAVYKGRQVASVPRKCELCWTADYMKGKTELSAEY